MKYSAMANISVNENVSAIFWLAAVIASASAAKMKSWRNGGYFINENISARRQ
jgi:hypothetical protein